MVRTGRRRGSGTTVVVNERLGRDLFGDADPVNQVINLKPSNDRPEAGRDTVPAGRGDSDFR